MGRNKCYRSVWELVDKRADDDCWPWTGMIGSDGYGKRHEVKDGKDTSWRAHRLIWTMVNGVIPKGQIVCHRCDRPLCCNPAHLFLGTTADNHRDKSIKGRSRWASMGRVKRYILTPADVLAIRAEHARGGVSLKTLATNFGVAKATILDLLKGRSWADVKDAAA